MDWYDIMGRGPWDVRIEIMVKDEDKDAAEILSDLPKNCAVGSIAYKASLSFMAMFNGTDWVEIGGGEE